MQSGCSNYLRGSKQVPPSCATFRLWRPYWIRLVGDRQAIGCVCVHHATHEMLSAAINALRRNCHVSKNNIQEDGTQCRFGPRCDCRCSACANTEPLLRACVCATEPGALPLLSCIKQDCVECGLEKVLVCPRKERNNAQQTIGKVRLMLSQKHAFPGYDEKSKIESASVERSLEVVDHRLHLRSQSL